MAVSSIFFFWWGGGGQKIRSILETLIMLLNYSSEIISFFGAIETIAKAPPPYLCL